MFSKFVFLKNRLVSRLRRFNIVTILERRELIGGVLIREEAVEFALWEKVRKDDGNEEQKLMLYKNVSLPSDTIVNGRLLSPVNLLAALKTLEEEAAKSSIESVIVSLPSALSQFSILTFPKGLTKEQINEAIVLAAESSFPLPASDLYFDRVMLEGHEFNKIEAIVGIARIKDIEQYLKVVSQSGFTPIAVETHSMSLARLFPSDSKGRAVLIIEPSEITGIIYDQGFPHLQFQVPRQVLEEELKKGADLEEKIVSFLERIIHSAVSGGEHIDVNDILIMSGGDPRSLLAPFLEKKKMPPLKDIKDAVVFPGEPGELRDAWMASTLGVAARGLIPRRSDKTISLMAIGTEEAYEGARLISFLDFLQKISISFGIFLVIVFAAAFIFVNTLGRNADERLAGAAEDPPQFSEVRGAALVFNQHVNAIAAIEKKTPRWDDLFVEIDKLRNPGVSFRGIGVTKDEHLITVEGRAQSRDSLLLLKAALENSSIFSSPPIPLPTLLAKDNIDFSLRLKLKNPEKFSL